MIFRRMFTGPDVIIGRVTINFRDCQGNLSQFPLEVWGLGIAQMRRTNPRNRGPRADYRDAGLSRTMRPSRVTSRPVD